MRRLALLVLAFVLAPSASAATERMYVEMRDDGFRAPPDATPNPTLHVEPGSHVVVRFQNNGTTPQNLHVGDPVNVATGFAQRPGESADLAFDAPADFLGDVPYWSDADPERLHGILHVGKVPPSVRVLDPAEGAEIPGDGVTMNVTVAHFVLEPYPFSPQNEEGHGHLQYLLDARPTGGPTDRTTFRYANLAPGPHVLRAQLVERNASFVDPPAFDERLVHVKTPPTPVPEPPSSAPEAPAKPTPFPAALALAALALSASRFRRRR